MVVNFEFLGSEPIENVITCLHYQVDKVVFFGYSEVIAQLKEQTDKFLKHYCGVQTVEFHAVSYENLKEIADVIRLEVSREIVQKNQVYFDVTGGESLILVAFGMIAQELNAPIHMFDVVENCIIDLKDGLTSSITRDLPERRIPMTIEKWICMHGGIINHNLHKGQKNLDDCEYAMDVERIYQLAVRFKDNWNAFCGFLRRELAPEGDSLQVSKSAYTVIQQVAKIANLRNVATLNQILDALADAGALLDLVHADGWYRFRYKSTEIKNSIWEDGCVLELHTYGEQSRSSKECCVGVYIDWDGEIHYDAGTDVVNEIDVLAMEGNVPIFISCKSGKMSGPKILHALYELETVAKRFGGKYAKKKLVTIAKIEGTYRERASEMGIEIISGEGFETDK